MHKMQRMVLLAALVAGLLLACGAGQGAKGYVAKDFSHLKGMKGFSDKLLEMHFALYQGYVKNASLLAEELARLAAQGQAGTPAFAELKRRFGWELNGMRLHELYFGNLGGKEPLKADSRLMKKLQEDFGGYDKWAEDFKATGMMRGIGWAVLVQDPMSGRLFNLWINEHDVGHLAGGIPILIMDVFEHAFITDYGLKRADYIQAFFENINWAAAEARLMK